MPRTMIGLDSLGYGCIKITKNNSDDPYSTADTDRSKFLYNSKFATQCNLSDIQVINVISRPNLMDPGASFYYPAGTGQSNYVWAEFSGGGSSTWIYKNPYFSNLRYNLPLYDIKAKEGEGSTYYNQQSVFWFDSGSYYNGQGGFFVTGNYQQLAWMKDYAGSNSTVGSAPYAIAQRITRYDTIDGFNRFLSRDKRLITWNLPGNNQAVDDAPILAPNGSQAIDISSTQMRIARPGYPVSSATVQQMAFDANKIPVKVVAAGDISLPSGSSSYNVGFTIPDTCALDVHFYTGSTVMYPANPNASVLNAKYRFNGSNIEFVTGSAMRGRFMLYLEDTSAPTPGSNSVWKTSNIGGVDVVQFLRPGSADPPSWADIVIDTRWPQVQILAEGYFSVASGNGVITDIPFDGTGMFPMVKYVTDHGAGSYSVDGLNQSPGSWSQCIRLPFVKMLKYIYSGQSHAGESTYCELTANNARFRTYRGNVGDYYNRNDSPGTWRTTSAYNPIGIRYYIFGIPQ